MLERRHGIGRHAREGNRFDVVPAIGGIGLARDAVRRSLAGRQPPIAHTEIVGPFPGKHRSPRALRRARPARADVTIGRNNFV